MCDELSVVLAPAADAAPETPALFSSKGFTDQSHPVAFSLKDVKALPGDAIWIRYGIKSRE